MGLTSSPRGLWRAGKQRGLTLPFGKREHEGGGDDAESAGGEERREVGCEPRTRQAGPVGRARRAELVAGENPAEDEAGVLASEPRRSELHGRRHGGDPVEAVEHREQRQAEEGEISE